MPGGQFRIRLSPEEMSHRVGMLESGIIQCRVAVILNAPQSVVSQMWNRHLTHGHPSQTHVGGRYRATTQRQDRFLMIQSQRQRFLNATRLNNKFRMELEYAFLHKQSEADLKTKIRCTGGD